jgi:hypothetical protein
MINYSLILSTNYTNKSYVLSNNTYEGLEWYDSDPKPTKKQLDSQSKIVEENYKKNQCKTKSKQLIENCDWSVLPDVKIENRIEFENYREILRNYILNPVENPIYPEEPTPIWIIPKI